MKQHRPAKSRKADSAAAKAKAGTATPAAPTENRYFRSFPIVGMGASAGGLEAFTELLQGLPVDTGMGFVLVQHLDPDRASELTHILARATAMPVREVAGHTAVEPNHVYIIPPNARMSIGQGVLKLHPRPAKGPVRGIDAFFESLAEDQRECAIGIVLSGTASDGTLGLEAIKAQGGITFAQDGSAKYESMPQSAIAAGCVDLVLSPKQIANELARIANHVYVGGAKTGAGLRSPGETKGAEARAGAGEGTGEPLALAPGEEHGFAKILGLLRNQAGVDFSLYRNSTIQRRITRRIVINKLGSLQHYARFLGGNAKELDALYADLLINVTSFFRNPEAFDVLKRVVFPKLVTPRRADPVRVWVAGCSSGQEAYSLAMALTEYAERASIQMFATDLSEALLEKARAGLYAKAMVQDLSPQRLRRFFIEEEGGFRIIKSLRDGIVFARQNLLSDPPFSRMDLISCRNLMIYLESSLQRRLVPAFHYALKPEGYLFLGASESVSSFTDLFEATDRKHKIYARRAGPTPSLHPGMTPRQRGADKAVPAVPAESDARQAQPAASNPQREADRIALNRYAPPGILLNAEWQVLQFRGDTSPYLKPPTGKANFNVLNMAREELKLPLRAALKKAKRDQRVPRKENLQIDQNGRSRTINLEVVPLLNLKERFFLVFFEDAERSTLQKPTKEQQPSTAPASLSSLKTPASSRRVAELERELTQTRDYLQSLEEQHEAANEELQASNEEVTSANEELQSINEELETSKEELESSNEELRTVNEEMDHRNAELGRLNSDLINFQSSANMAIVLLALDQTVRRFTAKARGAFSLTASDIGRSINSIRFGLDIPDLEQMVAEVMNSLQEREREVRDKEGRWYSLRVIPYRSVDNTIDGAVLVLVDIDVLKRNAQELIEAREYTEAIVRSTSDMLVVLDADLRVHSANQAFYETFGLEPGETEGRLVYELGNGQWNIPRLRELLEEVLPRNKVFTGFEVTHEFENIGQRVMVLNARMLAGPEGQVQRILLGIHDTTEMVEAQARVRRSELRYRRLFEAAQDGVLLVDTRTERVVDANPFMTELVGRSKEELRDKTLCEAGLFEDKTACRTFWERVRRDGYLRVENMPLVSEGGARREVEFISNLYQENGASVLQCNVRDISERKHAEKMVARLAAIVEWSDDAIVSKRLDGTIETWNAGAERMFEYKAKEVIGRPVTLLLPPELLEEEAGVSAQVQRGESIEHYETVRVTKGGRRLDVSLTISPIKDREGRVIGASQIVRDIGDLIRARDVLARGKEELMRLVDERTAKLQELVGDLEHFSYTITHDMRAPLRGILGYAELMVQARDRGQEQDAHRFLERVRASAERMDHLITDALNYSKTVRQELTLSPVDVGALLRGMLDSYPELQPAKARIKLRGEIPRVMGNEAGLTQCFSNLLGNAVKFVRPGEKPEIVIWAEVLAHAHQPDGHQARDDQPGGSAPRRVRISVEDKGIGVPESMRSRVFDMFSRGQNAYEGTGIGLALVRKVVQRMGGKVGLESEEGRGSRFWLELESAERVLADDPSAKSGGMSPGASGGGRGG